MNKTRYVELCAEIKVNVVKTIYDLRQNKIAIHGARA